MAETSIEWTEHTWNPIVGCSVVSPGCTNCYAMRMAARLEAMGQERYRGLTKPSKARPVWTGQMRLVEEVLTAPLKRRKPTLYFVNSMSDLFHENVADAEIDRVFAVMALCPQHTFQVLTKRSARMRAYLTALPERMRTLDCDSGLDFHSFPLPNVWLGVSAEDQRRADERVPDLLATPAALRFVSAEPLLKPIDFTALAIDAHYKLDALRGLYVGVTHDAAPYFPDNALDWIIVGGESGPGARPMHPDWARQIRDACAAAGVAFLFKQWGSYQHGSTMGRQPGADRIVFNDGRMLADCTMPACKSEEHERGWQGRAPEMMALVGKKAAGRLLDGVEHDAMPRLGPSASEGEGR